MSTMFEDLPINVVFNILSYSDFKWKNWCLVNKKWNVLVFDYLANIRWLYFNKVLPASYSDEPQHIICSIVDLCKSLVYISFRDCHRFSISSYTLSQLRPDNILRLDLSGLTLNTNSIVALKQFVNLERLSLSSCIGRTGFITGGLGDTIDKNLMVSLTHMKKLKLFGIENCHFRAERFYNKSSGAGNYKWLHGINWNSLTSLHIRDCFINSIEILRMMKENDQIFRLKRLTVTEKTFVCHINDRRLEEYVLLQIEELVGEIFNRIEGCIKTLYFDDMMKYYPFFGRNMLRIGSCTQLTNLQINYSPALTNGILEAICNGCQNISRLSIIGAKVSNLEPITKLSELEVLDLYKCIGLKDRTVINISMSNNLLSYIDIRECENLTPISPYCLRLNLECNPRILHDEFTLTDQELTDLCIRVNAQKDFVLLMFRVL